MECRPINHAYDMCNNSCARSFKKLELFLSNNITRKILDMICLIINTRFGDRETGRHGTRSMKYSKILICYNEDFH